MTRGFITFALLSVQHVIAHRSRHGDEQNPSKERKAPRQVELPDTSIHTRKGGPTVQLCGDWNVAEKWIIGHCAIGQKYRGKWFIFKKRWAVLINTAQKYLGRIIKRTEKGFTIQADPEFYDRLLEETGLDQGVSSCTLGTNAMKPTAEWKKEAWDEDLDKDSHKHYLKIVGMLRWLVAERPDIMFDVKNVSENLQSPKCRHWQQVKRIVRYLAGTRDCVQKIEKNSDVIASKECQRTFPCWLVRHGFCRRQEEHFLCSAQTGWSSHPHTFPETDVDCDKHGRGRNVRNFVGHI